MIEHGTRRSGFLTATLRIGLRYQWWIRHRLDRNFNSNNLGTARDGIPLSRFGPIYDSCMCDRCEYERKGRSTCCGGYVHIFPRVRSCLLFIYTCPKPEELEWGKLHVVSPIVLDVSASNIRNDTRTHRQRLPACYGRAIRVETRRNLVLTPTSEGLQGFFSMKNPDSNQTCGMITML